MRNYSREAQLYALAVTQDKWHYPVAELEILRCQRFLTAYERNDDEDWKWVYDNEYADHACTWLENVPHIRGEWVTKKLSLLPHQVLFVCEIYGWRYRESRKVRRFRESYSEVARGNGKTFLTAAIGLYELCEAGGNAAEVIAAATTGKQAQIVLNACRGIAKSRSFSQLSYDILPLTRELRLSPVDGSEEKKLYSVNSNSKSLDGLSPCLSIIDEFHAHEDRKLYDVLASARGKVPSSWIHEITTAGYNTNSAAYKARRTGELVLRRGMEGVFADRSYYMIHTIDDGDSIFEMENIKKANPIMAVSKFLREEVESDMEECKTDPSKRAEFETKRCNKWRHGWASWIPKEFWDKCECEEVSWDWIVENCAYLFIGIDLSSNTDITSVTVLGFVDDIAHVSTRNFIPEDTLQIRIAQNEIYQVFEDAKCFETTPGDFIDHRSVEAAIFPVLDTEKVREVWLDQYSMADRLAVKIMEQYGDIVQTITWSGNAITLPAKEFESRVKIGKLKHDGNHATTWMVCNAVAERRVSGTLLPKKEAEDSELKIDALHSQIIAFAAWLNDPVSSTEEGVEDVKVVMLG